MSDDAPPPEVEETEAVIEDLEARGFLAWTGEWQVDPDGVRRKTFAITPAGQAERERLDREERL